MAIIIKRSLVDQIYEQLREEIINQEITWGEKLNVNELQERFGISCTPIREAINRLQKEGIVEYKNNVGAKVIEIGEKDIIEIQEVVMTMDCAAIRYAMETGKINEITEELLKQIKCYQEAKTEITRSHAIEAFSNVFYKYAGNSRLISISHLIKGQQGMLRSTYGKERKDPSDMEEHIKIYKAVLSGDVNAAINAMEDNYKKGTKLLLEVICNIK
ncbi:GntR family transcriptional regulator [Clostridium sp. CF012]|uniref:GntR family transcriptional regulator n=1 Tax=Clostridium sp. CF012 TaxID=2843319 RepID=UPI00209B0A87|nr:GntR family transcriptional regulator [Clostridium sp. CF012]